MTSSTLLPNGDVGRALSGLPAGTDTAIGTLVNIEEGGASPTATVRLRRLPTLRVVVEAAEPSAASRLVGLAARLTIRPALTIGGYLPHVPWPLAAVDSAAGALPSAARSVRRTIRLPHCTARVIRGAGVPPADGTSRVVLYLHGGGFVACGANTHGRLVTALSKYADAPALMVNYRLAPKHSIATAKDDCYDGYRWLREQGYRPDQIVLAGDSAGGYLALALATRLAREGERPAALVCMSPLTQIAKGPKQAHPNIGSDVMFSAKAFDGLVAVIGRAARRDAHRAEVYQLLDHIGPGLPPTLIHVSDSEVLLHDARLAAQKLAAAGVPVELRVWRGQMHVFQLAGPMVPEAIRSLRQIGSYIREATSRTAAPPVVEENLG